MQQNESFVKEPIEKVNNQTKMTKKTEKKEKPEKPKKTENNDKKEGITKEQALQDFNIKIQEGNLENTIALLLQVGTLNYF